MSAHHRIWSSTMGSTTNKNQNISIQLRKFPRSPKNYVLSDENLTENEINQKSTSDKTKRRVAHVPKIPLTVTKKQENPEQQYPKRIQPEIDNSRRVQNLRGTCHNKIEKLRNFINTIPWDYKNMCFSRNNPEKRRSDHLESTQLKLKKPKTNTCDWTHRHYCIDCATLVKQKPPPCRS